MKTQIHTALILSIVLVGCGGDELAPGEQPSPQPTTPQVMSSIQSACKGSPAATYAASGVSAQVNGSSVTVSHADAIYNCAAKVQLSGTVSGSDIIVTETITNPNEGAYCMCTYDLSIEIKGLAAGTYTAKVIDAGGKLVGTASATVAPMSLQVINSLQSACKGTPMLAVAGPISAKQQGGSLIIQHDDAVYNCASKVKMTATLFGTSITVQEVITNPGDIANCMCTYDLSVELKGLAAGSYTVKVLDADGNLVGTLQVTI